MITNDPRYDADVKALKGYEDVTTTSAMGKIAQDANGGKPTVTIHAGDKSYDDLIAEYKSAGGSKAEIAEANLHALEVGAEVVAPAALEATGIATAAVIAGPIAALALGIYNVAEANARGDELGTALARDEQHVAMVTSLALPSGFKADELAKYPHAGKTFQSSNQKMTTAISGQDHALMAIVQLHCDQGMNAARELCDSGGNQMMFMASHPQVAVRYGEDPAFKAGFDAVKWAHAQGPAEYKATIDSVNARDAKYGAAGVSWRV